MAEKIYDAGCFGDPNFIRIDLMGKFFEFVLGVRLRGNEKKTLGCCSGCGRQWQHEFSDIQSKDC